MFWIPHRKDFLINKLTDSVFFQTRWLRCSRGAGRTIDGKDEKIYDGSQKIEGQYYSAVTILFADFVGFTKIFENTEPGDLLETLNTFFSGFEKIIQKNNVLKVKTIGDCFMCVGGIPGQNKSHAHDVCNAAKDMHQFVDGTKIQQEVMGRHDGNCELGSILGL